MTRRHSGRTALWVALVLCLFPFRSAFCCTTAVISGRATPDGRPLLWKNRDVTEQDNVLVFFRGGTFDHLGLVQAGQSESVWGGINSAGFALFNAASDDLEGTSGTDNGRFLKLALETCASVDDLEALLRATGRSGRRTRANYGAIDASGGAAMFEVGSSTGYGLLAMTRGLEEALFRLTDEALGSWRTETPAPEAVKSFQDRLSRSAYRLFRRWSGL